MSFRPTNNYWKGRSQPIKAIVIHWWGSPSAGYSMEGVIRSFQNPVREASAHYVISGKKVVQMVREGDTAWHASRANPFSIGLELDPNKQLRNETERTAGKLVRGIRERHGDLPLRRHRRYAATICPGTISLKHIDNVAKGGDMYRNKTAKYWYDKFIAIRKDLRKKRDFWKSLANRRTDSLEKARKARDQYRKDAKAANKKVDTLEAKLATQSDDTKYLNMLGKVLRYFIERIGVK